MPHASCLVFGPLCAVILSASEVAVMHGRLCYMFTMHSGDEYADDSDTEMPGSRPAKGDRAATKGGFVKGTGCV